jgi:hypothetical protein
VWHLPHPGFFHGVLDWPWKLIRMGYGYWKTMICNAGKKAFEHFSALAVRSLAPHADPQSIGDFQKWLFFYF